jgi:riboflavin-specific deaminase-like protein
LNLRRLIPQQDVVDLGELLASMDLAACAVEHRPYTVANFISSADGRAAIHGHSGPLSDKTDRELFHRLREQVDAVLVGTGTLRAERYGRLTRDPERRRRRLEAGLEPEPLACIVSRSGAVPTDIPLFAEPETRILIFSPSKPDLVNSRAQVELVILDSGELTLTTVLRRLRSDCGIRSLLCEGGPTVFGSLLQEHLVDELFLTLSPRIAGGGSAPTIASGTELPQPNPLEVVWALEHEGALYLRYALC